MPVKLEQEFGSGVGRASSSLKLERLSSLVVVGAVGELIITLIIFNKA